MEHRFIHSGETYKVTIEPKENSHEVTIDDKQPLQVEVVSAFTNSLSLLINGKIKTVYLAEDKQKKYLSIDGNYFELELEKGRTAKRGRVGLKEGNVVCSPMPGSVVKIFVSEGNEVKEGQVLTIVEAMKMENELKSPIKGKVKKVNFSEGEQVDALQPIVELEAL